MALTTLVKDELANYEATKVSARKAEISTILRFTGGLHIVTAVRRWLARPVCWICVAARCVACRRPW